MPTVDANGVELHYEYTGDPGAGDDRPPVVFLHGMGLDHRYWPEVTDPLTDDYEVVVFDMRLHGRSGGSAEDALTVDTFVDDLHALVDALDLDRPAIVGHSMGGMVALRYVDRYPDAVSAVVTIGSETPDTPSWRAWVYDHVVFPLHYWLRDALGQAASDRFMFTVNWLARDDAGLSDLDEFERVITDHHENYPEPTDAERTAIEDAIDGYGELDVDYEFITAPVLAMYGERELAVTAHHAHHLSSEVPNGRTVEVPHAAHVSPVDNPAFVIETLRDFLDEHLTRTHPAESG